MNNNRLSVYCVKYLFYAFLFVLLSAIQSAPHFLEIFGGRPILLYPCAIAIAMADGELVGGIFGAFAGLLCDHTMNVVFGFNSILLLVCCAAVGLLTIYYIKNNLKSAMALTAAAVLIRDLIFLLFGYLIFGYKDIQYMIFMGILPCSLYTIAVTPIFYYLFRFLHDFFENKVNR